MKSILFWLLITVLLSTAPVAQAQQPAKIPRIGYLSPTAPSTQKPWVDAFRQELQKLNWREEQNVAIEYRWADGKSERLLDLASELVRLPVDVLIAAGGTPVAVAARKATSTIPIVMINVGDPVGLGLVASLARPGGNVTGLSRVGPDLSVKKLELIKEILPKISRVALAWNPDNPANAVSWKETAAAAEVLRLQAQSVELRDRADIELAFAVAKKSQAMIVQADPVFMESRTKLCELAVKNRLPMMLPQSEYVDAGCLISYGENLTARWRRAAAFVDKILRGSVPADIPVEQPMKFEFVANLNAAKKIGLTIPPNVLVRADRVIR